MVAGLFSCKTPAEQLAALIKKNPELAKRDTVFVKDTIRITRDKKDTIFSQSRTKDTVVLDKGRLLVKYFYSNDTVFLQGECRDSVIIKERPVYITDVRPVSEELPVWFWWVVIGAGLFGVMAIIRIMK